MPIPYNEFEDKVCKILGRSDAQTRGLVVVMTNAVQRMLARMHRWKDLEMSKDTTLVIGKYEYTLLELGIQDSDLHMKPYSVVLVETGSTGVPLEFVTPAEWDMNIKPYLYSSGGGRPHCYSMWGRKYSFYKVPDKAYSLVIRYYKYPTDVGGMGSTLAFEDCEDLMLFAVAGYCWSSLEEYELASMWLKRAGEVLRSLQIEEREIFDLPKMVGGNTRAINEYWNNPFIKEVK